MVKNATISMIAVTGIMMRVLIHWPAVDRCAWAGLCASKVL